MACNPLYPFFQISFGSLSDLSRVFRKCQQHALKLRISFLKILFSGDFLFLKCSFLFHPNLHSLMAGCVREAESMKYQLDKQKCSNHSKALYEIKESICQTLNLSKCDCQCINECMYRLTRSLVV